jgi:predicted dehydrogenase
MTTKTIRFGILGCGLAAGFHAAAIQTVPGAHQNVIRDFCEALNEGRRPISDVTDGYNALALISAAYLAAEKGPQTPVYLEREEKP